MVRKTLTVIRIDNISARRNLQQLLLATPRLHDTAMKTYRNLPLPVVHVPRTHI